MYGDTTLWALKAPGLHIFALSIYKAGVPGEARRVNARCQGRMKPNRIAATPGAATPAQSPSLRGASSFRPTRRHSPEHPSAPGVLFRPEEPR